MPLKFSWIIVLLFFLILVPGSALLEAITIGRYIPSGFSSDVAVLTAGCVGVCYAYLVHHFFGDKL